MSRRLPGASVWEQDVYGHLDAHEDNERELLVEYRKAADDSGSAAFQYLSALIVEDEIRHHRVFRDLASALKTDAELRPEPPAVPRLDNWGPDAAHVVELTEGLLAREREDAKELHRLAHRLRGLKDDTMWQLLVRLMEMDTEKHIAVLEFVKQHARKARPPAVSPAD